MICPFKFTLYGFEGGQDCIGSECGMHNLCNADDEITAVEFDALDEHAQALERENTELRVKCDEHDEAERDWERKFNEAMGKEYSMRKELIAELDELRAGEWAKADNAIRELSEENDELRAERDALVDALGATDAIEWSQEQLENANPALVNALKAHDTREELEADALALVDNLRVYGFNYAGDAEVEIIGMLERQAAITKLDTLHDNPTCPWSSTCATNRPISESADRETPDTTGIGASKDEIRDFDVWSVAYEIYCAGGYVDNGNEPNPPTDGIRELLARQAAITARETIDKWDMASALRIAEQDRTIVEYADKNAELQAKVDGYVEALEKLGCSVLANGTVFWPSDYGASCSELQKQVEELTAERDEFRDRLGKVLDLAGEIGRLA